MDGVLSEFFRQSIVGDVLSVWYFDWFVLSFRLHVPVFVLILIRSSLVCPFVFPPSQVSVRVRQARLAAHVCPAILDRSVPLVRCM